MRIVRHRVAWQDRPGHRFDAQIDVEPPDPLTSRLMFLNDRGDHAELYWVTRQ